MTTKLTYDSATSSWGETTFDSYIEFRNFIESLWKTPGSYHLKNTNLWRPNAIKFQKDKRYTDIKDTRSREYKDFWNLEKRKCIEGVIIDGMFIPGDYYFYLNFCPIYNKIEKEYIHPEVWDSDYHFYLYLEKCYLYDMNSCVIKKRQCLVGSTVVYTPQGLMRIDDMVSNNYRGLVYSYDGTSVIEDNVTDAFSQGVVNQVYKVTTKGGASIECTADHLINTTRGWVQARDLTTKDILIGYSDNFGTENITSDEAKVIGYFITDGSYPSKNIAPKFTNNNLDYLEEFETSLVSWFPECRIRKVPKGNGWDYVVGNKVQSKGQPNNFKRWAYSNNLCTKGKDRKLPEKYMKLSKDKTALMLNRMFSSDGWCHKITQDRYELGIASSCIELIHQIKILLQRFGITSRINHENINFYKLRISEVNSVNIFFKEIGIYKKTEGKLAKSTHVKKPYDPNRIFKIQVVDKEVEVFDLTVEKTNSFFANGIHVHNCGYSLKHVSIQIKNVWFVKGSINKLLSYDETFVRANWNSIAEIYRDHLNEHTGWYRNFNPDKTLEWMQKVEIQEGILEKKKVSKGRKSKYLGYTTKGNPTKPVGGPAHTIFIDEAGINPTLNKTYRYGEENTRIGGVKTGYIYVSGAVGELKDCEPLQEFAFNPTANGFLGVKDIFANSDKEICFFVPDIWNFIYTDPDTRQTVKCYDQDGNSNIPMALKFYTEWDEFQKKQLGERDYKLWKCQHPLTLQEAFEQRESNIFPTSLLKKRDTVLIGNKPMVVKIVRDSKGKLGHEFCDDVPITKLKVNPEDNNAGAIQVIEFPPINPPWGMYYAGVDPVWRINTSTSKSLQSVTIYRGMVEKDGKLVHGYPVAVYTGRHKHIEETYDTTAKLIEYYNAKAAVESNVKDFIEWMIQKGKAKYLMRRREITLISEMIPNSTIRDEIGVRMEGEFKKRCLEKVISYIEQPISTEYDLDTGESNDIYGIEKLWDRMLIKEMLEWHPKLNTDRLIAFSLALIAATSDINRQLVVVPTDRPAPKPVKMYSPFHAKSLPQTKKLTGHFRR